MLCGLLKADEGDIIINGLSIKNNPKEARALIGMCPQNVVIWRDLSCIEQVEFMGTMYDVPINVARKRGIELLNAMGLIEKKDKRGKTLSGGMQRRLNIILSLIHNPQIIILDEPEAGLDPQSRVLVREYIKALASQKTIILTTHNMDEAERLVDRVAIIDGGNLLAIGTPNNLKKEIGEEDILEIRTLFINSETIEKVRSILLKKADSVKFSEGLFSITAKNVLGNITDIINMFSINHISIEDIRIRKKTLEDVFISLTGRGLRE
jgi:ABC-2 type transport system ATP-binding protein